MAALPIGAPCFSRDNVVIARDFKIAVSPLMVPSITSIDEPRRKSVVMHTPVGHPAQHGAAIAVDDRALPTLQLFRFHHCVAAPLRVGSGLPAG